METPNRQRRIHFEESGAGVPIVLGHSFLCDGDMWRGQILGLSEKYRLINVDFRGHGRSAKAPGPFTLYDAVDDVVGVLDELGIEQAVWCGLSIGGMVAMRAALTVPERVKKLIILDSDAGSERAMKAMRYRLMATGVRMLGFGPFLYEVCRLMFGHTTRTTRPELVEEWREKFAAVDIPSMLAGLDALVKRDSILPKLPEISVPALVVVGNEDASLPVPLSRRIADALPDAEFVEIDGAGHLSALEQPERVNETIDRFLG